MKEISDELYAKLDYLGIIPNETRNYNESYNIYIYPVSNVRAL